jgi:hypothetical protein
LFDEVEAGFGQSRIQNEPEPAARVDRLSRDHGHGAPLYWEVHGLPIEQHMGEEHERAKKIQMASDNSYDGRVSTR